jgi:outer membrane receptor protein involved in Fe transport
MPLEFRNTHDATSFDMDESTTAIGRLRSVLVPPSVQMEMKRCRVIKNTTATWRLSYIQLTPKNVNALIRQADSHVDRNTASQAFDRSLAWRFQMATLHSALLQKPLTLAVRLALAALAAVPLAATAQDSTTSTTSDTTRSPAANEQIQRVEVTGSRIRRTDTETPSPVQIISAKELKQSGYTSVSEVLRNVTANGQGTLSQSFSGAFAAGASGISLRGLTVGATLVLIDGQRMAPYALSDDGQRSFVDISQIPMEAIERIEVLMDGASSI